MWARWQLPVCDQIRCVALTWCLFSEVFPHFSLFVFAVSRGDGLLASPLAWCRASAAENSPEIPAWLRVMILYVAALVPLQLRGTSRLTSEASVRLQLLPKKLLNFMWSSWTRTRLIRAFSLHAMLADKLGAREVISELFIFCHLIFTVLL